MNGRLTALFAGLLLLVTTSPAWAGLPAASSFFVAPPGAEHTLIQEVITTENAMVEYQLRGTTAKAAVSEIQTHAEVELMLGTKTFAQTGGEWIYQAEGAGYELLVQGKDADGYVELTLGVQPLKITLPGPLAAFSVYEGARNVQVETVGNTHTVTFGGEDVSPSTALPFYKSAAEKLGWSTTSYVVPPHPWDKAVYVAKKGDQTFFVLMENSGVEGFVSFTMVAGPSSEFDF